jgi:nucleoside-diphosphate-sugar epimerase
VDRLLVKGHSVRIYQRSNHPDLAERGVEVICGDLTDTAKIQLATEGVDAVFHVAALAGIWGPKENFEQANVQGTHNVLAAVRKNKVPYLVHTSTPSVVFSGESFEGDDESLPYGKNWLCHYARTKAEAEQAVLEANSPQLATCALRPHLIWGPGDPHLLPRVIESAKKGRLKIVGDGSNRVDVTYVENAADAHIQALDALIAGRAGGKAYFISQGEPVALWDWINALLERLGEQSIKKRISAKTAYRIGAVAECIWKILQRKDDPPMTRFVAVELSKSHWYSIESARQDLGYRPESHPMEKGLTAFTQWWKTAEAKKDDGERRRSGEGRS